MWDPGFTVDFCNCYSQQLMGEWTPKRIGFGTVCNLGSIFGLPVAQRISSKTLVRLTVNAGYCTGSSQLMDLPTKPLRTQFRKSDVASPTVM